MYLMPSLKTMTSQRVRPVALVDSRQVIGHTLLVCSAQLLLMLQVLPMLRVCSRIRLLRRLLRLPTVSWLRLQRFLT